MPFRFCSGIRSGFYPNPVSLPHRPGWRGWLVKLAWYLLAGSILWLARENRRRLVKRGSK